MFIAKETAQQPKIKLRRAETAAIKADKCRETRQLSRAEYMKRMVDQMMLQPQKLIMVDYSQMTLPSTSAFLFPL